MPLVKVIYSHRVGGTELVTHEKEVGFHKELCKIIDDYPWVSEVELAEEPGVSGGFEFLLDDYDGKYAIYYFIPIDTRTGLLDAYIIVKPGFLKTFGRKAVSMSFGEVLIVEAKEKVKELFDCSIEDLYERYSD